MRLPMKTPERSSIMKYLEVQDCVYQNLIRLALHLSYTGEWVIHALSFPICKLTNRNILRN